MIDSKLTRRFLVTGAIVLIVSVTIIALSFVYAAMTMKSADNAVKQWKEMDRMVDLQGKARNRGLSPEEQRELAAITKRAKERKMREGG